MSPPLPHLLPTSPPAWLPGFRARTSPVGDQAHPPSVLAFVLGRGRGADLVASRQLGSQVRAASSPEGQRSRESPDALASGFLGHLPAVARLRGTPGCRRVPLAWGPPGGPCLSPCPSAPGPASLLTGPSPSLAWCRAARPRAPAVGRDSPVGSGLCVSGSRGGISPDRFACCGGLCPPPPQGVELWERGGAAWILSAPRHQVVLADGLLGFVF